MVIYGIDFAFGSIWWLKPNGEAIGCEPILSGIVTRQSPWRNMEGLQPIIKDGWEYHAGRFQTRREIKELKKQKGVKIDGEWLAGDQFRQVYGVDPYARDYYLVTWRTQCKK